MMQPAPPGPSASDHARLRWRNALEARGYRLVRNKHPRHQGARETARRLRTLRRLGRTVPEEAKA